MEGNGGQCYCLRWNNYQSSVVAVMRALLHDGAFLDVTLACDGRSLQAHRLMLASCSDFFSSLLKDNQTEHPIIFLRDVNFWELEAIMDFIYNGQVNIMQEQLPGFIRTAEALQIKGLAAVNNNNNAENFSLKQTPHLQDIKYSAITALNNNNTNTNNNNNSVAENLSQKYNAHLNELKYNASVPHNNNNNSTSINNNNTDNFSLKYNPVLKSYTVSQSPSDRDHGTDHHVPAGLPSPPERDSPPPLPPASHPGGGKRRRHDSPQQPHRDSDIPPRLLESPSQGLSPPTSEVSSPLKGSSPFSINDTIHSLALSAGNPSNAITSVASMASISVAKAISLSKLVHEISSQASIASLKSAALPPHPTAMPPDDVNGWGDEGLDHPEPHTPPPPQQPPPPHVHNTKDWAANKNEDGFPACSLCGKVFKHQGSLVAHYQVHQQRTKCPVCQKVLSRHYHMKVHLLTVHKVPDSEIDSLLRTQCV